MTGDMAAIFGEFIGTMILIVLGSGVCAAVNLNKSKAQGSGWIVIAFGWAMGVAMAAYISGFMGPAHLNPAVTVAMAMTGNLEVGLVFPFIIAQMLGAIVGAVLIWLAYLPHWAVTEDQDAILGTFATAPAIRNYPANVMTEILGTFILVLGLLAFTQNEFAGGVNVLAVGGLILAIGLSLGGPTGYAINPARDLGPRIAHAILPIANKGGSDWAYSWVPIVGPMLGAVIAVLVYQVMV
ncbi:MIP/aquaporin family protein [Enterococcus pallens]|uniref:MIP family channel protein n=1 Tax=Enterococcus pallens ATCC BAA-351 TaxID=1158607 RepID=R2RT80_9ENTE|nr:MIP/aquaporin family protein [Enterococcus pallens]EOH86510.1 MIP family channel protein [Enterococcus pallens ATCC BAA-351]EOU18306.1 glycerol uptake facilitator protein [Enterococcus pallens ATCC BAA-351]OJG81381.1 MIP family channel protein [Enterococcus pallens]